MHILYIKICIYINIYYGVDAHGRRHRLARRDPVQMALKRIRKQKNIYIHIL